MMGITAQGFNLAPVSNEPMPLSSLPLTGPPMGGMAPLAPMGQILPTMGLPGSMSMPQPLMSGGLQPTGTTAQAAGTNNPFLL